MQNLLDTLSPYASELILRESVATLLNGIFDGSVLFGNLLADSYRQCTDGHELDLDGFIAHLKHVQNSVKHISFTVLDASFNGSLLADRHIAEIVHNDGRVACVEVFMLARINDKKIAGINELTRSLDGNPEDCRLASSTGAA